MGFPAVTAAPPGSSGTGGINARTYCPYFMGRSSGDTARNIQNGHPDLRLSIRSTKAPGPEDLYKDFYIYHLRLPSLRFFSSHISLSTTPV